ETAMLNMACTQVGRFLGLPTHGYLVATDSKHLDAQAGMESAVSALLGTLAGINMISGAGMLDSLACHSIEKLILDAEAIASSQRLVEGIQPRADRLAVQTFQNLGDAGEFLKLEETRLLFRKEQHFPSAVIERGGDFHSPDLLTRARARAQELVGSYKTPMLKPSVAADLLTVAHRNAESA